MSLCKPAAPGCQSGTVAGTGLRCKGVAGCDEKTSRRRLTWTGFVFLSCLYRSVFWLLPGHSSLSGVYPGRPMEGLLGVKYHVDDSIWWSFEICSTCTIYIITCVWPQQIGLTVEGVENRLVFLHCELEFRDDGEVQVHARNQNISYAKGLQQRPAVCGIPPYIANICSYRSLSLTFSTRLWSLSGVYTHERQREGLQQITLLATEALRLGWPVKYITAQLCYHRNHRCRWFHVWTKTSGIWLRRNRKQVEETRLHTRDQPELWGMFADEWFRNCEVALQSSSRQL